MAAWTFCSRGASCSQPMMTLATGWLKLNCKSSAGEARPAPVPTSMPWPMTFIDRMPKFFCSATGRADCSKVGIGSIFCWAIGIADALKILKIAQAVDLNQVDVVGLQELKTRFYRTKCAVPLSRIDLGGEEDFFA